MKNKINSVLLSLNGVLTGVFLAKKKKMTRCSQLVLYSHSNCYIPTYVCNCKLLGAAVLILYITGSEGKSQGNDLRNSLGNQCLYCI